MSATRLVTVADLKRVRVEAEVDEFDIGGITLGAAVKISAEGFPEWPGEARSKRSPTPSSGDDSGPKIPADPPIRASSSSRSPCSNHAPQARPADRSGNRFARSITLMLGTFCLEYLGITTRPWARKRRRSGFSTTHRVPR